MTADEARSFTKQAYEDILPYLLEKVFEQIKSAAKDGNSRIFFQKVCWDFRRNYTKETENLLWEVLRSKGFEVENADMKHGWELKEISWP